MRVIAGRYKGRRLTAPTWEGLRPTSDKLRETLFNILAPRIEGARVLDGYAGTGAVGIEAISRGAAHDVVVPKGRVPELFDVIAKMKQAYALRVAAFGHAGDGNIHVNIMVTPGDDEEVRRAHEAERVLFEGVVALEGSISGEHGIGFAKAPFLPIELSPDEIALMKRVKRAFDPNGILNPGKIFPE